MVYITVLPTTFFFNLGIVAFSNQVQVNEASCLSVCCTYKQISSTLIIIIYLLLLLLLLRHSKA